MRSIAVFVLAATAEIADCFAFWMWLKLGRSAVWLLPGVVSLALFAFVLTRVESDFAGRHASRQVKHGVLYIPSGESGCARSCFLVLLHYMEIMRARSARCFAALLLALALLGGWSTEGVSCAGGGCCLMMRDGAQNYLLDSDGSQPCNGTGMPCADVRGCTIFVGLAAAGMTFATMYGARTARALIEQNLAGLSLKPGLPPPIACA